MDITAYEGLTGNKVHDARDNWQTLCPVHFEDTPSFFIHKESYLSHCFGCGVRGTVDFILARAFETSPEKIRKQIGMPKLHPLLNDAIKRKVLEESFSWAKLYSFPRIATCPFLDQRGFHTETVVRHAARWDKKYRRIVFPITTVGSPDIVGACGRTVICDPKKWYFYWNTRKGSALYQLPHEQKLSIIVEGIFDEMWLYQHGYTEVGALLGADATPTQINIIKGATDEVILFLDNDEAGRIGQRKLANALRSSVKVAFAKYPEGKKDPQELTKQELDTAIGDKLTYVQYSCNHF